MVERTRITTVQITEICTAPSEDDFPTNADVVSSIKDKLHADDVVVKSIKNFDMKK